MLSPHATDKCNFNHESQNTLVVVCVAGIEDPKLQPLTGLERCTETRDYTLWEDVSTDEKVQTGRWQKNISQAITLDVIRSPSVSAGTKMSGCPRGLWEEGQSDVSSSPYATNHGFWALNKNW